VVTDASFAAMQSNNRDDSLPQTLLAKITITLEYLFSLAPPRPPAPARLGLHWLFPGYTVGACAGMHLTALTAPS
jgi:hypothetical protein